MKSCFSILLLLHAFYNLPGQMSIQNPVFIQTKEFIYDTAAFPSAHASTILSLQSGTLLAAWFGGTDEGNDDVEIWISRKIPGETWSRPEALTNFPQMPTWNPVLFEQNGTIWIYFKIGPSPQQWIGAFRASTDGGISWGPIHYLPAGLLGPIRCKPLILADGTWLAGSSMEAGYRWDSPADAPYRTWSVWIERSTDQGVHWSKQGPVTAPDEPWGVIQPTLWHAENGEIRMLMRSTRRLGKIMYAYSKDQGMTWSEAIPTQLPNPNAGIDVVKLQDGSLLLVYNHTTDNRKSIHVAVSHDDGLHWSKPCVLEEGPGEYSYPAVIQAADGMVHLTYTWQRERIRHLVLDPQQIPQD
ncbi:MAG TPA: exo-alpha-sialidase [Saprospiraceae bacterium]|nr:exo-alpha-sialidase [Saprospiraceae bacterium]